MCARCSCVVYVFLCGLSARCAFDVLLLLDVFVEDVDVCLMFIVVLLCIVVFVFLCVLWYVPVVVVCVMFALHCCCVFAL